MNRPSVTLGKERIHSLEFLGATVFGATKLPKTGPKSLRDCAPQTITAGQTLASHNKRYHRPEADQQLSVEIFSSAHLVTASRLCSAHKIGPEEKMSSPERWA